MEHINPVILMFSLLSIESAIFIPSLETNKPVPVREESLILSCFPVAVFSFGSILWRHPGDTELSRCYSFAGGICNLNTSSYAFTANSTGSYAFIHSLNRTRDSGLWQCGHPDVGWLNQTVVVFASPVGVKLVPSLSPVIDLGMESLTLKCQTANCTFPAPNITWYIYNMTSTQISPYTGSFSTLESDTIPCTEQEAVYTSTLQLPRGTTFQGNIPLTTKFLCGLEHPTLGQKVEYSQQSSNVTFAAMFIPSLETNKPVPVREESLILSCFPVAVFSFGSILWRHPGDTELSKCFPYGGGFCNLNTSSYAFTANSTGSYAFIHSLNRTRDSGLWQCGYPDVGWLNQTVVVFASPVGVKLVPSLSPVIDLGMESLTLKCQTVNCTFPAPNITWYIYNMTSTQISPYIGLSSTLESDTSPCTEQEAVYTSTLQLPQGTTFQGNIPLTTKFLCGLEHPTLGQKVEYSQQSSNVTFADFPRIQFNTTSPLTVNETQFLSVSCSATGNPNPDQIFWSGRPDGSLLRFENISRNDNGTYTCKATANSSKHGMLRSQMEFNIIVQYAPDVSVTVNGPTLQNMSLTVLCEARGLPAEYTFHSWKQMWGDKVIRSYLQGTPSSNHNTLKLERLSLQDMGTYICSVDNNITGIDGKLEQTGVVHLKVMGIPTVLKEEEFHFAELAGHSINMSIPFYSNPAIESFTFQKNGSGLQNNSRITVSLSTSTTDSKFYGIPVKLEAQMVNLFIHNLTQDDFDSYTLVLRNFLGTKEFRLQLDAAGPPWIVDVFHFNRFIEKQVEFNFKPGFNGGRNQTFAIEYRSTASPDSPWMNSSITDVKETQTYNGIYFVNVTQPPPGTYEYRMYSWNEIGRSPYSVVITLFIPEVASTSASHGTSVAGIVGGVIAGFVIILIVAIGILLWRRYQHRKKNEHDKDLTKEREESTRRNQIKASYAKQDVASGKEYEGLRFTKAEATQYLQLNDITLEENRNPSIRSPEGDSYEKLHPYTNNDIQMYSSLNIPETSKDSEPKYENSVIK